MLRKFEPNTRSVFMQSSLKMSMSTTRQLQAMLRSEQISETQARERPPLNDGGSESSVVFRHQDNLVQSGNRSILQ